MGGRPDQTIIGLVGEAVEGYPLQLKQLAERLDHSLPTYALMKERPPELVAGANEVGIVQSSRIVWCNRHHIAKLGDYLRELVVEEQRRLHPEDPDWEVPRGIHPTILLTMIKNHGQGLTDDLLYNHLWADPHFAQESNQQTLGTMPDHSSVPGIDPCRRYSTDDESIVRLAESTIPRTCVDIDRAHAILKPAMAGWAKKERGVIDYPRQGWVERHRFPCSEKEMTIKGGRARDREWIWVEVRKWPWLEVVHGGNEKRIKAKGVVVIFQDITEIHMRRTVVWRWVQRHLKHAQYATSCFQRKGGKVPYDQEYPMATSPLIELEIVMLRWFRKMVEEPKKTHEIKVQSLARTTRELEVIISILQHMRRGTRVQVDGLKRPLILPKAGHELFAIVLALLINAGQSTIRHPEHKDCHPFQDDAPSITINLQVNAHELELSLRDHGVGFDPTNPAEKERIMSGLCFGDGNKDGNPDSVSKRVLMPGAGVLVVKYILRGLLGMQHDEVLPSNVFDITSTGRNEGATAIVRIAWSAFSDDPPSYAELSPWEPPTPPEPTVASSVTGQIPDNYVV